MTSTDEKQPPAAEPEAPEPSRWNGVLREIASSNVLVVVLAVLLAVIVGSLMIAFTSSGPIALMRKLALMRWRSWWSVTREPTNTIVMRLRAWSKASSRIMRITCGSSRYGVASRKT